MNKSLWEGWLQFSTVKNIASKINGTARFLIVEGTTKKLLQIIVPFKSIYNKKLGFVEQKMYFEQCWEVQKVLKVEFVGRCGALVDPIAR
jgi:hypothetical protein